MNWLDIILPSNVFCDAQVLQKFECDIGCRLPSDYRDFLLKYNGGKITAEHNLQATICGYDEEELGLSYLLPLSKDTPLSGGVIQMRGFRSENKIGIERAIEIGDDGGTGFFFLMLAPRFFGQVYFCWKDVMQSNSPDWASGIESIPDYMGLVSMSFAELGEKIKNFKK